MLVFAAEFEVSQIAVLVPYDMRILNLRDELIDAKRQPRCNGRTNFSASLKIIGANRFWR
jgi:hypothetical protein